MKKTTKDVLDEDEFEPENVKVRITTFIDMDILQKLKLKAASENTKYQTLLNQILRDSLFPRQDKASDLASFKKEVLDSLAGMSKKQKQQDKLLKELQSSLQSILPKI